VGKAMSFQHKELANGRWTQMSLCEQMANIGSEVSRAFNWRKKNRSDLSQEAINRALELLDLTVASLSSYSRLKECLRVRECIIDYFYGNNEFSSSEIIWRKYFDAFVYATKNVCYKIK
jgi:hypothetical protein